MNIRKQFNIREDIAGQPTPAPFRRVVVTMRAYAGNDLAFNLSEYGAYDIESPRLDDLIKKYLFGADASEQIVECYDNDLVRTIETTSATILLAPNGVIISEQRSDFSDLYKEIQAESPKYSPELMSYAPQGEIRRHLQKILHEAVAFYKGAMEFYSE